MMKDQIKGPWSQKLALIESLTLEQMLGVYPEEYMAILSCTKIPHTIFQRILRNEPMDGIPLFREQLHLVCSRHLDLKYLEHFAEKSPFDLIREMAAKFIHIEKNSLKIGLDIVNRAGSR